MKAPIAAREPVDARHHPSASSWPGLAQMRHGRACPGHPRLFVRRERKDVDARHKAGHDGAGFMRAGITALSAALYMLAGVATPAVAAEPCDIPASLLSGGWDLKHVTEAVAKDKRLTIAVVGTGSSLLAGPDGPRSAYPARLEAVLRQKLPGVDVRVVSLARSRMTAEDLARGMDKMLTDEKPDLVIWQTGTLDAIRRIEPDEFRAALDEGVETLHKGGADVILMNMQYSPRTDIMVPLGPYADNMRVVAQQHEIPLFDRLAVMRNWSDTGAFDLYAAGKDNVLAQRVHDCIARGIAFMIIDAAHLHPESKAAQ
jgi:lysophospholipase L1-like esterase